jgi:hypothetical protein
VPDHFTARGHRAEKADFHERARGKLGVGLATRTSFVFISERGRAFLLRERRTRDEERPVPTENPKRVTSSRESVDFRDRDGAYGEAFIRRLTAMGIRNRPISARSPWQIALAERLIGSIRRDCLDHVVIFGEQHLHHLLNSYQEYYNESRTRLSLKKDAPNPRDAQRVGRVLALPILGGLHHRYVRV